MQLPKELTTVTTVSKAVALVMFISLPIIAFLFGMRYQIALTEQNRPLPSIISPTMTPKDAAFGTKTIYTCPKEQYVNCMPGPDKIKKAECTSLFLQWAQKNCQNFKGAAY